MIATLTAALSGAIVSSVKRKPPQTVKRNEAAKAMDSGLIAYLELNPLMTLIGAESHALMGDRARALYWMERAVRNGDERIEWFRQNPWLVNVRSDPRFEGIISSIASRRKERQAR